MGEQNDPKGPKDGGMAAPAPHLAPPQETEADRRKAKRRHFTHYRNQVLSWAVVIVLTALSYHLEVWYRLAFIDAIGQPSPPLWVAIGYYLGLLVPPVAFLGVWIFLGAAVHFSRCRIGRWPSATRNRPSARGT
jgi:hypothetical protein